MLPTRDPPQNKRPTQTKWRARKKYSKQWTGKKSQGSNSHIRQNRLQNKDHTKRPRRTLHNTQGKNPSRRLYPALGLYPKNPETPVPKNLCTPMFIAAQFTVAKCWKQKPKCPSVNEWIKNLWYIYTMEFYAAERKKELLPFSTAWIELESIMLS